MLLRNLRAVTPDGILPCDMRIDEQGMIAGMGRLSPFEGEAVYEADGAFALPGGIDTHLHGGAGIDVFEMTSENLLRFTAYEAAHGVTGLFLTTRCADDATYEALLPRLADLCEAENPYARILGIHMEGPFLDPVCAGAQASDGIAPPTIERMERYIGLCRGHLRLMTVAPNLPGIGEIIRYATGRGVRISMGHTAATYDEAKAGADAGATRTTHTYNAMRPFRQREPGVIGAALTDDRLSCEIICDFLHVHPAAVSMLLRCKTTDKVVAISDSGKAAGSGEIREFVDGQWREIRGGAVYLPDGVLAGSATPLGDTITNLRKIGIPFEKIAAYYAANAALDFGLSDCGTLCPSMRADIVLCRENGEIVAVFCKGKQINLL